MGFKDLDEFFDSSLRLPVGGKTYVVPSPDAATGLKAQRLMETAAAAAGGRQLDRSSLDALQLDDDDERDFYSRLLGPAWEQMIADGVAWAKLQHCGQTAFIWVTLGTELAERFWESGGSPEAPAPNRAARRAAGKGSGKPTSTASRATSNRRRATTSSKTTSPGRRSSSTGR